MATAGARGWIVAGFLLVVTVWGLNYLFVRNGLSSAAPLWLAFGRAAVGMAGAVAIVAATKRTGMLDRRGRRDAMLLGIPNTALFFGLWFLAAPSIPAGATAVVIYTFPLWVALLAGPVLGERLGWVQGGAVGVGFTGVALLSEPWRAGASALAPLAVAALLLAAVSWAIGTVLMQRRFRPGELREANAYQLVGGSAGLLLGAALLEPRELPQISGALAIDLLWLGLAGTAVAYTVWFELLGRISAGRLSLFTFLVPIVALGAAALLEGERLDLVQAVGVGFVLAAIVLVSAFRPAVDPDRAASSAGRPS